MLSQGNFYSNVLRERKFKTFDLISFPWPLSQGRYRLAEAASPEVMQLFFKSLLLGKAKRSAEGQNGGSLLGLGFPSHLDAERHTRCRQPSTFSVAPSLFAGASSKIAIGVERVEVLD